MKSKGPTSLIIIALITSLLVAVVAFVAFSGDLNPSQKPRTTKIQSKIEYEDIDEETILNYIAYAESNNWNTYSNDSGYSFRYPKDLYISNVAAGSFGKFAGSDSRHIIVYDPQTEEPYLNKIIETQRLGRRPSIPQEKLYTYNINGKSFDRVMAEGSRYDRYYTEVANSSVLEIYVSNQNDRDLARNIFYTLDF